MDIQSALKTIGAGQNLTGEEMHAVMLDIMTGQLTQAQIGGFLVGLRMKGESIEEITAAATVMRELVTKVEVDAPHLLDIVGTGGDGSLSFNISTASSFVVAAAGGHVAKHGNRAASGKCGSADLLEHAGARIDLAPEQIAECITSTGFGFMMAPAHHTAMRHAVGARKELGIRTIFNALGPLTNPALVKRELMGVFSRDLVEPLAHVLNQLGLERALVVHSDDDMDEISVSAPTFVAELKDGTVSSFMIEPADFGISPGERSAIVVQNPAESLQVIESVLAGDESVPAHITQLNSGAALYVAGLANDLEEGVAIARAILNSGAAREKLDQYVEFTRTI